MAATEYDKAQRAAAFIRKRIRYRPRVGLILGSGLGAFADSLGGAVRILYQQIPHFPVSTAVGHAGRLVVGLSGKVPVAVLQGRAHYYEGYAPEQVVFPTRVLKLLGVQALVVTNAAGGISARLKVPSLMLIRDHINHMGLNPLRGRNDERFGPRFPDMTEAYSKKFRALAKKEARRQKLRLPEGVYAALHGPSYETPAEIQALKRIGADAVGMSTVPEVTVASHMGMKVLGISSVTNLAAGLSRRKINHEEVLAEGERIAGRLTRLLHALAPLLAKEVE